MNYFHHQEQFLKSFNAPFIAFIPKKDGIKVVRDFRPISLLGSFYKILSEVLAGRLKKVMGNLISSNQMAFVKGQQISDAHECLDSRIRQGLPGILHLA